MKDETIAAWGSFIGKLDLSDEEKSELLASVRKLVKNDFPIILSQTHFAKLIGFKKGIVSSMVHKTAKFYRTFSIPKKRGGFRKIVTPHPSLLEVQRWICGHILNRLQIHQASFAYRKGRNTMMNAKMHIGQENMLVIDLKDFFGTISEDRISKLFSQIGYNDKVAKVLKSVCCLDGTIPQGGATSPTLSNIVLYHLDSELSSLSSSEKLIYTRYADDLVFSGKSISNAFEEKVRSNIHSKGFQINERKRRLLGVGSRKIINGIVVKKDTIRLPKYVRRKIRQEVYFITKNGVLSQIEKQNDIYYIDRIIGKLNYWKQVEPNNPFVKDSLKSLNRLLHNFEEKVAGNQKE